MDSGRLAAKLPCRGASALERGVRPHLRGSCLLASLPCHHGSHEGSKLLDTRRLRDNEPSFTLLSPLRSRGAVDISTLRSQVFLGIEEIDAQHLCSLVLRIRNDRDDKAHVLGSWVLK